MKKISQHRSAWTFVAGHVVALVLIMTAVTLAGCTAVVQPHMSSTEFLVAGDKIPGTVQLYISDAFKNHKETKTDVTDLKEWQFELGPVAADAFRFGLESHFTKVAVTMGDPRFPILRDETGGFFAVVKPKFHSFAASDPILVKFENYTVEVGFLVDVYDTAGSNLLSKQYIGKGVKRGSIGYESAGHAAYPVAAQAAIKNAVDQAITDIVQLAHTYQ